MRFGFRRLCELAVVLAVVLCAPLGHAQGNAAAAQVLFEQGRAAMAAKEYDKACERFRASDKIDPQVGTKFNLAECERLRGNLATAWELFRAVSAKLQPHDQRLTVASGRAAALEQRLPRVTLRLAPGAPPDTSVRIGKMKLGVAAFGAPLPLDPGKHNIVVSAPGFETNVITVKLKEGEQRTIDVGPKKGPGGPTPTEPGEDAHPSWIERHTWSTVTAVLALGLGGAGIGVGAAAWSSYDELVIDCAGTTAGCADEDVDSLRTKTIAANVLLGTAGAAAITSLVMFFFVEESAPEEPGADAADETPETAIVPVPYTGAGLQIRF